MDDPIERFVNGQDGLFDWYLTYQETDEFKAELAQVWHKVDDHYERERYMVHHIKETIRLSRPLVVGWYWTYPGVPGPHGPYKTAESAMLACDRRCDIG